MPLRFLTAGESHGKALVGILEGLPAGLAVEVSSLRAQLARRKLGFGRGARQKIEDDAVEIVGGVRRGFTLGGPVALVIENKDFKNWAGIMQVEPARGEAERRVDVPRPGHADLIGGVKYAHEDMRNVLERSSARETAARVALATLARLLLAELGVAIGSRVTRIGSAADDAAPGLPPGEWNARADASQVRCLSKKAEAAMVKAIESAGKDGDTLGGVFEAAAEGLPVGLGSYAQWDRRLEARLTASLMSLNAVKGVEVGLGFEAARLPGSKVHDEYLPERGGIRYASNRSGGIDGGMTTGQPVVLRAAMKPLSTLMKPLRSVNLRTGAAASAHIERSDVCAVPAAAVIAESLLALDLADAVLEKFGGDSMRELKPRVEAWRRAQEKLFPPVR